MSEPEPTLDEFADKSDNEQKTEWRRVTLKNVCQKRSDNVDPQEAGLDRHIGLEHIEPNTPYPNWESLDGLSSTKRRFKPRDILFAKLRPNLEKVAQPGFEGVCSTDIFPITTKIGVNSKYLLYLLSSKQAFDHARRTSVGTRMPRTSWKLFNNFEFEIPPLEEQRKIASVLYTVDQAIQKTEEIIEQANSLKSGVIQQVFRDGVEEHASYIETKSGHIPENWELIQFKEITEDTRYGTDTKSNMDGDGYPTLRIPNVVEKRITLDDLKYTPLDKGELERLKLEENDILVIRTNGNPDYVGRCATFSKRDEPFVFASYLIRVRVDESRVRHAYVREFFNSYRGRSEMAGWIRSSAGNYNLSVGAMEKFQIPIPPLDEQDKIVENVKIIEQTIEISRQHRDRLQRFKQGLMQDLLSGKTRTTDTNIAILDEILAHG